MKDKRDFDIDLKRGQRVENELHGMLMGNRIEVKTDFAARTTGNLYFEFRSRGELSGLAVTKAEFWAHVIPNAGGYARLVMLFRVEDLKRQLRKLKREGWAVVKKGGDEDSSEGLIVPAWVLLKDMCTLTFDAKS